MHAASFEQENVPPSYINHRQEGPPNILILYTLPRVYLRGADLFGLATALATHLQQTEEFY